MKVCIIDDEAPSRRELKYLLSQIDGVEVAGEASTGAAGLKSICETDADVAFLDIQMPGLNGLEVSRILSEMTRRPLVIFTTAFQNYAVEAFEVEAFDYILKPYSQERVRKAIAKVENFLSRPALKAADLLRNPAGTAGTAAGKRISLIKGEKIIPTQPDKILFVRCHDGELSVHTTEGKFKAKATLQELEQKLSSFGFIRTHRSFLANINHVSEVVPWFNGSYKLIMDDKEKTEVLVSRYNAKDLKQYFDL
ncbi:MAG TPA: LytTR family DNA-binding domain-containing protein [Nitrospirota bacterium]|nr:LytTR family DNA-binding domain-containing protein [Nitrospirota bacterium]